MTSIRVEIREDDGSFSSSEARTASPEQIAFARELTLDITDVMTLPTAEPTA